MNSLVEFLAKHYPPMGVAFRFTSPEELIKETRWTREEVLKMTLEALDEGELVAHFSSGCGMRWTLDEVLPEDLLSIGAIGSSWKPHHKKVLFKQKTAF